MNYTTLYRGTICIDNELREGYVTADEKMESLRVADNRDLCQRELDRLTKVPRVVYTDLATLFLMGDEAEKYASKNRRDEVDGWTYTVKMQPNHYYRIEVADEAGFVVGNL